VAGACDKFGPGFSHAMGSSSRVLGESSAWITLLCDSLCDKRYSTTLGTRYRALVSRWGDGLIGVAMNWFRSPDHCADAGWVFQRMGQGRDTLSVHCLHLCDQVRCPKTFAVVAGNTSSFQELLAGWAIFSTSLRP